MNQHRTQEAYARTPPTRREALSYALLGAFLLFLVVFAIVVFQMLLSRPPWRDLGATGELESEIAVQGGPIRRVLTQSDTDHLFIWLDYANGTWVAFDGYTPFGARCRYEWVSLLKRFQDPCSGARFSRTGEYLDVYTYFSGTQVRNLDQYPVEVRGDHLLIDVSRLTRAEPFYARAPSPECCGR